MFLLRTLQLGIKSLLLHPMRSLLTVLGIFIGVASVIWLLAIAEGMSIEAQKQIEGLGADNIIVRSIKPPAEATAGFSGPVPYGLKREEYELLRLTVPTIRSALPIREVRRTMSFDGRDIDGRLVGCTPEYFEVTQLRLDRGRLLTEADIDGRKNFCVIASGVAEKLFPYQDPLGRRLFLSESKDYYQVIGILKYRTPTAAIGGSLAAQDFSSDVYIPISTLRQQIGDFVITRRGSQMSSDIVELDQITLRIKNVKLVPQTAALVRDALNIPLDENAAALEGNAGGTGVPTTNTSVPIPQADLRPQRRDVALVVPYELLEQARMWRLLIMVVMGLIAGISLLVGGIGIMNIMLATVTERTREIGIRRALGATQRHIVMQFLVETVSLSVVGGLTGILFGLLGPPALTATRTIVFSLAPKLAELSPPFVRNLEPQIVWGSLPLSFGISVIVGVVFGIYPAIRAAKMDPIEALRHE